MSVVCQFQDTKAGYERQRGFPDKSLLAGVIIRPVPVSKSGLHFNVKCSNLLVQNRGWYSNLRENTTTVITNICRQGRVAQ